jgi:hypothetical protein
MGGSALRSNEPSSVWLADLIEAAEVVAASAEPCDAAIVKAFSHHLQVRELLVSNKSAYTYKFSL